MTGLKDAHYGEVVGAFLGLDENHQHKRPTNDEIRDWCRRQLGKHKAPTHIFWLGYDGIPATVPLTGSGKVRKFEMAQLGNQILEQSKEKAKL